MTQVWTRPGSRFAAVVLALLLVFFLIGSAHASKVGGSLTLKFSPPGHFSGKLSTKKVCRKHRRVKLKYWATPSGPAQVLDSDLTAKNGRYSIDIEPFATAGEYQAVAVRKLVHHGQTTIDCRTVVSLRHDF